ncbi:hypothetical protein SAMN05421770_12010 [Granulicella rosea]|uniref:Uncharacterized protein n=1 Tax=Granulicella rosea TaxID=474952 RepID=A0A239MRH8_9BACT|nr:hypothetical protein SAMN05421770_12010 [Granulicella rosea]
MSGLFLGCSKAQADIGAPPDVRVSLSSHGLPAGFFQAGADKCAGQIIGYRFVVWLNNDRVAVGFNTSPNCRQSRDRKVDGLARILIFDLHGTIAASRDVPYLADGYGEMVADGEAEAGPGGTLLFRIQSVNLDPQGANESKSAVLLLDANLKDVTRLDRLLEQATFLNHALVFQEGFTLNGPRTYSVLDGSPPVEIQRWTEDWPVGTMDRKFGEHQLAYMLCRQELRPNVYSSTNIIYAGAKRGFGCQMSAVLGRRRARVEQIQEHETCRCDLGQEQLAGVRSRPRRLKRNVAEPCGELLAGAFGGGLDLVQLLGREPGGYCFGAGEVTSFWVGERLGA